MPDDKPAPAQVNPPPPPKPVLPPPDPKIVLVAYRGRSDSHTTERRRATKEDPR